MDSLEPGGLKVLIVEDNQYFRLLIRTVLGALGVEEIAEARDGGQALDMLARFPADLVIVDWKMQPMDGVSLVRHIRSGESGVDRRLPVLMVSGYSELSLLAAARDAGVNEFLPKPISARSLVGRIMSILRTPRPFVDSNTYFGPDRRRRQHPYGGPDRRGPGGRKSD